MATVNGAADGKAEPSVASAGNINGSSTAANPPPGEDAADERELSLPLAQASLPVRRLDASVASEYGEALRLIAAETPVVLANAQLMPPTTEKWSPE